LADECRGQDVLFELSLYPRELQTAHALHFRY